MGVSQPAVRHYSVQSSSLFQVRLYHGGYESSAGLEIWIILRTSDRLVNHTSDNIGAVGKLRTPSSAATTLSNGFTPKTITKRRTPHAQTSWGTLRYRLPDRTWGLLKVSLPQYSEVGCLSSSWADPENSIYFKSLALLGFYLPKSISFIFIWESTIMFSSLMSPWTMERLCK